MKTRHARMIRQGIVLAREGQTDRGLRLHGIAWQAYFRTKSKKPNPFTDLWPLAQQIIINRASLLHRLEEHGD